MVAVRHLHVGGVVAMAFSECDQYLFVISHNGRGVFSTRSWERVARDYEESYPEDGIGIGIGPLVDKSIRVTGMDFPTETVTVLSRDRSKKAVYESGTIIIYEIADST